VPGDSSRDHRRFLLLLVLRLSVLIIFLLLFARIAGDLARNTGVIRADLQLSNLVQGLRTPGMTRVMIFVSDLGRWQTIVMGTVILGVILSLWRLEAETLTLALTISLGEIFVWLVKNLVHRQRPEPANALSFEPSFSFPSGHAFVAFVFYGLACALLLPAARRWTRPLIVAAGIVLVGAIGFARVYLGVHWPSDVLASDAAGAAWLGAALAGLFVWRSRHPPRSPRFSYASRVLAACALGSVWLSLAIGLYRWVPLPQPHAVPTPVVVVPAEEIPSRLFQSLPTHSEDLTGRAMEPVNIVLVGPETAVRAAFLKSGWYDADPISLRSLAREVRALATNRPYPEQPGTPSFWNGRPNMLTFEHATPANTIRERHHIHLGNTGVTDSGGVPIWVGTVHFDRGLRRSASTPLFVHSIDPDIDRQRPYVLESLTRDGNVRRSETFAVTSPSTGKNFAGDRFETDGRAILIRLE
jgi:undecaprenyl-diphosphatase